MAQAQIPNFVFRRNERVHLNRRVRQFSRLPAADVCASAVVMLDTPCSEIVWRVLAIHSIRHFPFHFPSRASPCAITFQLDSTKKTLVCYTLVHVKFNGVLNLAGTVKIRGFGPFSRWKSRDGGYRVRYSRTLKSSGRRHSCVVYMYYIKGHRVSFYEPMRRQNTEF